MAGGVYTTRYVSSAYTVESSACICEPPSFTLRSALHCFAQVVMFPMEYNSKSHLPLAEVSAIQGMIMQLLFLAQYIAIMQVQLSCMHINSAN